MVTIVFDTKPGDANDGRPSQAAGDDRDGAPPRSQVSPHRSRLTQLDALRGVAALVVMAYHYTTNYDRYFGGHQDKLALYCPWGHYGVDLFFIISGFVILLTLERTPGVLSFSYARFARLFPAYWAAVLLSFTLIRMTGQFPGHEFDSLSALVNVTMLQRLFNLRHINGAYWTLYVELGFYALMAAIFAARLQKHLLTVLAVAVAADIIQQATGVFSGIPGLWRLESRAPIFVWLYLFLIGIVFYRAHKTGWTVQLALIVLLCLICAFAHRSWSQLLAVSAIGTMVWLALQQRLRFLEVKALVFAGTISYSLYLVHGTIGYVIIRWGYQHGVHGNLSIAVAGVVAILVASLITFAIERPAHHWLRSRAKRSQPSTPAAGAASSP